MYRVPDYSSPQLSFGKDILDSRRLHRSGAGFGESLIINWKSGLDAYGDTDKLGKVNKLYPVNGSKNIELCMAGVGPANNATGEIAILGIPDSPVSFNNLAGKFVFPAAKLLLDLTITFGTYTQADHYNPLNGQFEATNPTFRAIDTYTVVTQNTAFTPDDNGGNRIASPLFDPRNCKYVLVLYLNEAAATRLDTTLMRI